MDSLKNLLALGLIASTVALIPVNSPAQSAIFVSDQIPVSVTNGVSGVFRFLEKHTFSNTSALSNAGGHLLATHNMTAEVNKQVLTIIATNLEPNSSYQLIALVGDDTSFLQAGAFTTDAKGKLTLRFMRTTDGSGNVKTNPPGKKPLPALLQPVSAIRQVHLLDGNDQSVLAANFSDPELFGYSVNWPLLNSGIDPDAVGFFKVSGSHKQASIGVGARGLVPYASYSVALNGGNSVTGVASKSGTLSLRVQLGNPKGVLILQTVSILDSANNVVLSGQVP